ncbi:MAG: sigma-54 dependent transcriptional regulator [Planctomycetota bacterium]|nr:sigma-54 dependent transcriptional regulator [Planctomycetota bacterium]
MPAHRDAHVLVVDDADDLRKAYAQGLGLLGYKVSQASNGAHALERLREEDVDVVVLDLHMPGMDGLTCLKALKEQREEVEVLIVTGFGTIPSAVEAMRLGAYDYVTKPFSFEELEQRLTRCLQARDLRRENVHLRGVLRQKYHCENLIGKSESMRRVFRMIRQVALSKATVLLQGKSGTGKELVARAIHFNSPVAAGPIVTVDCGAITPTVIESELFGHVKGAFTGAHQAKEGLFRLASGGTLFFDEIGELPLDMQTKLLRALQEREIRPVGSDRSYPVDVRVIAATHRDLEAAVKEGQFRDDLFYRLNVITINIPLLAEHKEDVPLLLAHFLKKHARTERQVERVDGQTLQALLAYDWPGNVRELENCVERALALGHGPVMTLADLPTHIAALYRPGSKPDNAPVLTGVSAGEAVAASEMPVKPDAAPAAGAAGDDTPPADIELTSFLPEEQALMNNAPLAPPASTGPVSLVDERILDGQNTLDEIERQAILATLRATNGDRTACARILGIDKSTLYRKLKRYNVPVPAGQDVAAETT